MNTIDIRAFLTALRDDARVRAERMESQPQYAGYAETAATYRAREEAYQIALNELDVRERGCVVSSKPIAPLVAEVMVVRTKQDVELEPAVLQAKHRLSAGELTRSGFARIERIARGLCEVAGCADPRRTDRTKCIKHTTSIWGKRKPGKCSGCGSVFSRGDVCHDKRNCPKVHGR